MFERMMGRAHRLAEQKARERTLELTEVMKAELPEGIGAQSSHEGVLLAGRGLRRRFALEQSLRWMMAGLK